jgi:hypothetical protein
MNTVCALERQQVNAGDKKDSLQVKSSPAGRYAGRAAISAEEATVDWTRYGLE